MEIPNFGESLPAESYLTETQEYMEFRIRLYLLEVLVYGIQEFEFLRPNAIFGQKL